MIYKVLQSSEVRRDVIDVVIETDILKNTYNTWATMLMHKKNLSKCTDFHNLVPVL